MEREFIEFLKHLFRTMEAILGLFIEITFIATFTQRFFGAK